METQTQVTRASSNGVASQELSRKTVFLILRLGSFGNARRVSNDFIEVDADKGRIEARKILLESEELRDIEELSGRVREFVYGVCLPFERGINLLPVGMIPRTDRRLRELKKERGELVDKFIAAYTGLCAQAAASLRTLYNSADYPSVEELRSKFYFTWQYVSYDVPERLKDVSENLFREEKAKAQALMTSAYEEARLVLRESLVVLVSHLRERLADDEDGKRKKFRRSSLEKLNEFLSTFDLRNVTDDEAMKAQVKEIRGLLEGVDVDLIRSQDAVRESVREGMVDIEKSLLGMVEDAKKTRKFNLGEE